MIDLEVCEAIRTRLVADTASGGLRASTDPLIDADASIVAFQAVPGDNRPYIVINPVDDSPDSEGFQHDGRLVSVQVSIFTDPRAGVLKTHEIEERIYGDALDQSDRDPEYGLSRWTPTLRSTDWTANPMQRESSVVVPNGPNEVDVRHRAMTFTTWVTKG